MSTIYRLFDLDYSIYVISDNVVELPVDQTEVFSKVMLDILLPKMGLNAISIEEACKYWNDLRIVSCVHVLSVEFDTWARPDVDCL